MQPEQQMQNYVLSLANVVTLSFTNYFSIYFSSKSESMDPVNGCNSEMHTLAKRDLIHISLSYKFQVKAVLSFPFPFI